MIPIFAANSRLLAQGWRRVDFLRAIAPIIVASVIGTALGVNLLALLDQRTFAILILIMVVVVLLRGARLVGDEPGVRRARILGPVVGFIGGVLQGTTSISSPLIGSFFHARKMDRHEYVIVLAAIFELNAAIQLIGYSLLGLYTRETFAVGLLGLVPTLVALMAGIFFRGRLDQGRFRQLIVVLLVLSVANLLWRTFGP